MAPKLEDVYGQQKAHDHDRGCTLSSVRGVRDIRTPDLVRLVDGQMPQQIRIDLVPRMRLARLRVLVDRRQAHLRHQPTDPMAANAPRYGACGRTLCVCEDLDQSLQ
jgi:hypothetical protein